MKIGISSTGKDLQSHIDPRLGRCAYFLIVKTEDMTFKAFKNESGSLCGGAGIQSARFLNEKGVQAVLTGSCGPNAMDVFNDCKIKVITGQTGLINEVIQNFMDSNLMQSVNVDVDGKDTSGQDTVSDDNMPRTQRRCMGGTGRGLGGGRGSGRGMGRGMASSRK